MSIEQIKHWVVLMFENRSFDSLLGHLPHIDAEDGIRDRAIELPYPGGIVTVHPTANFTDPIPDPGEGYPNVNVQVFGRYFPESNAGKAPYLAFPDLMQAPFNAPQPGESPTMDGFALDFFHNSNWQKGRELSHEEMQSIGGVFTPETAPVINRLAQEYAVFTNWHCDVPTCTFPNRSFFHAGTSAGRVDNNLVYDYAWDNDLPNLFQRMTDKGVDWTCYYDKTEIVPMESICLGGAHHRDLWKSHCKYLPQFFYDAANGALPPYSWVSPNMMFQNLNDYHPPTDARAGEAFLAQVYNAVRTSPQWNETALVVMFDEHGGCYDHVVPPAAIAPDDSVAQEGFTFDRLGIRVPTIVISAHTQRGTVIRDLHTNTSMTRTLREALGLGGAFTKRDAAAVPIEAAFNRTEPRRDSHQIDMQPYVAGEANPHAQQPVPGDEPSTQLMLKQRGDRGKEFVSELGEATLRGAAALLGQHPDDAPVGQGATEARAWLAKHFLKDGKLSLPTKP